MKITLRAIYTLFSLFLITSIGAQDYCEFEQKIVSSVEADLTGFGVAGGIAVSGDFAIVGALGDQQNGNQSGAAYIFERCGSQWAEIQRLVPPDNSESDRLGRGVSIWGDYAIAGAPFDDDMGNNSGSAYIYHLVNGEWILEDKIIAPDGSPSDWFGWSVGIWEDYAIIGAQNDFVESSFNGSASIYKRNGTDWILQDKLSASDPAAFDKFGFAVDIKDGLAIVGAYENDDNGDASGSAYVYKLEGDTTWNFKSKLLPSTGAEGDNFGYSVSISSERALVGSPLQNVINNDEGMVYVFKNQGDDTWAQETTFVSPEGIIAENFGLSLDDDNEKIIVGTARGFGLSEETGAAHFFTEVDGVINYESKIFADDGEHADFFSISVSVDENTLMCGAQGDDSNGGNAGSAYMFHVDCAPMCTKIINPIVDGELTFSNQSLEWSPVTIADGFFLGVGTEEGTYDVLSLTDVGDTTAYFVSFEDDNEYFVSIMPYNDAGTTENCSSNSFTTDFITIQAQLGEDLILSCDQEIPEAVIQYSDSCTAVLIDFSEVVDSANCIGEYSLVRTLTVSDECGSNTTTQTINVVDTEAPEIISFEETLSVPCGELIPLEEPVAVDNCNAVSIDFTDSGTLDCGETITRIFTVSDPCGNSTTVTQTITLEENTNPPGCTIILGPTGAEVSLNAAITWEPVSGASGYILNVGTTSSGTDLIDGLDVGLVSNYADGTWPLANTIYVTVLPYNEFGNALECSELQFETILVGIDELENDLIRISIYPNPSNDGNIRANILLNNAKFAPENIMITDLLGRAVEFQVNSTNVDSEYAAIELSITQPAGYYQLSYFNGNDRIKSPFVIAK